MAGKLLSDGWKTLSVVAGKALPGCWNTCAAGRGLPKHSFFLTTPSLLPGQLFQPEKRVCV